MLQKREVKLLFNWVQQFSRGCYLLPLAFLLACSQPRETINPNNNSERPSVELINSRPALSSGFICNTNVNNVIRVFSGDTIKLKLRFNANEALSQYKIDIHNNFDCHSHGRIGNGGYWQRVYSKDLVGQTVEIEELIPVPSYILSGDYHLLIQALDSRGREAPLTEFEIVVTSKDDPTPPTLTVKQPTSGMSLSKDDALNIALEINDDLSLANGLIEFSYISSEGIEYSGFQKEIPQGAEKSFRLDTTFNFPPVVPAGQTKLIFRAFDRVYNRVEVQREVTLQ